jgi:hypothetical protein
VSPDHSCRSLSKSPRRVIRIAVAVAQTALPRYFSKFSRHDYEQRQLFALLVLRVFFKTDYRGICQLLEDLPELAQELKLSRIPHYSTLCRAAQRLAKHFNVLLDQILVQAQCQGCLAGRIRMAIDSTGLEERHASRHYLTRCRGRTFRQRFWTKLAITCDTQTHLILAAKVVRGPGNECCLWKPLLRQAAKYLPLDTALADAAFDSEDNHVFARQNCGVRLTVIALNPRTHGRKWPKTKYRRQLKRRFPRHVYAQRSHAESTFSQHKRILGTSLRARKRSTRKAEALFRILVHNLMILRRLFQGLQQSSSRGEGTQRQRPDPLAAWPSDQ